MADIIGTSGDNNLLGTPGNDTLSGLLGNDTLNGGNGVDTLDGGAGNDTYVVDSDVDTLIEAVGGGIDTVRSSVSFTLPAAGGDDFFFVAEIENLMLLGVDPISGTGNSLNNAITGNTGVNTLNGGSGNDTLNGGTGGQADNLIGGPGDDVYVADALDVITEAPNGGTDTVQAAITYSLAGRANVENLRLSGSGNINGTGNELDNVIAGNAGNNTLNGGTGADTASYATATAGVTVTLELQGTEQPTGAGSDTLLGFENLMGSNFADNLSGNILANVLDGLRGADTLSGGAGDDTYVSDGLDAIIESAGAGTDAVRSTVDFFALPDNVENLFAPVQPPLTFPLPPGFEPPGFTGVGNNGDNQITGEAGSDLLIGGLGNDTLDGTRQVLLTAPDVLIGEAGDDRYIIYETFAPSMIIEDAGEGIDTVEHRGFSAGPYVLPANVENLVLAEPSSVVPGVVAGTGNALNNRLVGNSLANTLNGSAGADTIEGGLGGDTYVVDNAGDSVIETPGAGTDRVSSSVSYVLPANVEHLTLLGTGNFSGTGNALSNQLVGNVGANFLNGGTGADVLYGGGGNDTLVYDALDRLANGGGGTDTLFVGGAAQVVNLTLVPDTRIQNVEQINITGTGNNTLTLNVQDVLALSSTSDRVLVLGNAGDIVNAGSGWATTGVPDVAGFVTYTQGLASLLVDADITRNIT